MVPPDFHAYHKALAARLLSLQNQVRQLIGDQHWLSDGEHKEAVLREVLVSVLPQSIRVGRGFVCTPVSPPHQESTSGGPTDTRRPERPGWTSNQIDILLTRLDRSTLHRNGDFHIVTPDAVAGVIEVKTRLTPGELRGELRAIGDNLRVIRMFDESRFVWGGLYVFDDLRSGKKRWDLESIADEVSAYTSSLNGDFSALLNAVAFGQDSIVVTRGDRYVGSFQRGLAPAYFVNVCADHVAPIPLLQHPAYFPWKDRD